MRLVTKDTRASHRIPLDRSVSLHHLAVLYVWQGDYPWDVRTEKVCRALTEAGARVHLAARNRGWSATTEVLSEAVAHRMTPWRWAGQRLDAALQFPAFFSPRWVGLLARIVRRERPDAIIVRDLPLCPTAIWVGRHFGVPVVLDMAENYPGSLRDMWDTGRQKRWDIVVRNPRAAAAVERYCLRRLDHVLTVVEESADRLVRLGVPVERVSVVSNTPPAQRALPVQPARELAPGERLNLVYLGILEVVRGIGDLIDSVKHLRDQSIPVRATVVGGGRDMELFRARARSYGLTDDDVTFTGRLPLPAALQVVAAADIGVVACRKTEKWDSTVPNKLFDYMAAALPVLTSDIAPCARIVRDTGAGEVFRAGDAADMAVAIRRLADPSVRRAAGERGRLAVLRRYNWEHDASVLSRAIGRVAAQRPASNASAAQWRGSAAT